MRSSSIVAALLLLTCGSTTHAFPTLGPVARLVSEDGVFNQDGSGESVAIDGDVVVAGNPFAKLGSPSAPDDSGYVQTFVRNGSTWQLQDEFAPATVAANDRFGRSVAIALPWMLVGAPQRNVDQGAVFVFELVGGDWVERQELTVSEAGLSFFGHDIAMEGDTAVVGNPSTGGPLVVLRRTGSSWGVATTIPRPADCLGLGYSVALSGDTIAASCGTSAFVFRGSGATWTREARLDVVNPGANGSPRDLALRGNTLVFTTGNDLSSNFASIFERTGATWSAPTEISPSIDMNYPAFGSVLAVGDGFIVLGNTGTNESSDIYAEVFVKRNGVWLPEAHLSDTVLQRVTASLAVAGSEIVLGASFQSDDNPTTSTRGPRLFEIDGLSVPLEVGRPGVDIGPGDRGGAATATAEDVLVIGAPFDDVANDDDGSVAVYTRVGGEWVFSQTITATLPAVDDRFGSAVALSGDSQRLVVGAPGRDGTMSNEGRAYVYARNGASFDPLTELESPQPTPDGGFGTSVAVTADGTTIYVGAPNEPGNGSATGGAIHAFRAAASSPLAAKGSAPFVPGPTITRAVAGSIGDKFGSVISTDAGVLVAGAPGAAAGEGAVNVFVDDGDDVTLVGNELAPGNVTEGDKPAFGSAVAIVDGLLVVGEPERDDAEAGADRGAIALFDVSPSSIQAGPSLTPTLGGIGDKFGQSVVVLGGMVLGGAPGATVRPVSGQGSGVAQGSATLFRKPDSGTWREIQTLATINGTEGEEFGAALAASRTDLVVGAPQRVVRPFGSDVTAGAVITFRRAVLAEGDALFASGFEE